jgi:hypothetical protein
LTLLRGGFYHPLYARPGGQVFDALLRHGTRWRPRELLDLARQTGSPLPGHSSIRLLHADQLIRKLVH